MEEVVKPGWHRRQCCSERVIALQAKPARHGSLRRAVTQKDKYLSIFAGMAPATDPKLAAVVIINEPRW